MIERDYWPTKEWRFTEPEDVGMDSTVLAGLEPLIRARYSNLNGILIVRHGYVVHERYYNRTGPDDAHNVASVTKSVLSALIGMAVGDGLIGSLDDKVLDYFPEYAVGSADRQKQAITIRNLLTMTAPYPFPDWHEPFDRMRRQPNWVKFALDMMGQGGQIGVFKYCTSGAHLLSAILTRVTGKSAREFANERLFGPTGMRLIPDNPEQGFSPDHLYGSKVKGWLHDPAGLSTGGFGLTLTTRDMARFGFLYLNGGQWDGHRVVPEAWVNQSWQPAVAAFEKLNYGYLWWLGEEDGVSVRLATGDGGNIICCVPQLDLVVAVASKLVRRAADRMELVRKFMIPAVRE